MNLAQLFRKQPVKQTELFINPAKINSRKIAVVSAISLVLVAGVFYWLIGNDQRSTAELNKSLPAGVRLSKSLFRDSYALTNKKDGYSFKIPDDQEAWKGIFVIGYKNITNDELSYRRQLGGEMETIITSESALEIVNKNQTSAFAVSYLHFSTKIDAEQFVEKFKNTLAPPERHGSEDHWLEITARVDKLMIDNREVFKFYGVSKSYSGEETTLAAPIFYFFSEGTNLFVLECSDSELAKKIISGGKW